MVVDVVLLGLLCIVVLEVSCFEFSLVYFVDVDVEGIVVWFLEEGSVVVFDYEVMYWWL